MRIIIIGCGRMGAGLAQTLGRRGHAVTVVDRDSAAFEQLGTNFKGHTVVGVGFDREVLRGWTGGSHGQRRDECGGRATGPARVSGAAGGGALV
jgi:glycine/D-amino acid oxidase-like deaminating enzyme